MPETFPYALLEGGVADLTDHELVDAMAAARAAASRAQAAELAAVAELARRRLAEDDVRAVEVISPRDYLTEEVAQALTLTSASADDLVRFATELVERLPGTFTALAAGDIDYLKARTLWHCTSQVTDEVAIEVETLVLPRASRQTTGEIRAKARRLVKRLDPQALRRRREAAQRRREVTLVETDDGTAQLVGADLPADAASAAYGRVSAIAAGLKHDGDSRSIGQLRADVFLALLRGTLTTTAPPADTAARLPPDRAERRDAGWSDADADADADTDTDTDADADADADDMAVDDMATDVAADVIAAAVRAQFTALGSDLPHRHLRPLIAQAAAEVTKSLAALRARWCASCGENSGHGDPGRDIAEHQGRQRGPGLTAGENDAARDTGRRYRVPPAMRRLVEHRDRHCCFPGCRRPVRHCDADHSIPFHRGGVTCPCKHALR